jgi:hypothetical protein
LRYKIDRSDGVVRAAAVVGNVGEFAVIGGDYFVRIRARGDASDDR